MKFSMSKLSNVAAQTDTGTNATENITFPHTRVVINENTNSSVVNLNKTSGISREEAFNAFSCIKRTLSSDSLLHFNHFLEIFQKHHQLSTSFNQRPITFKCVPEGMTKKEIISFQNAQRNISLLIGSKLIRNISRSCNLLEKQHFGTTMWYKVTRISSEIQAYHLALFSNHVLRNANLIRTD